MAEALAAQKREEATMRLEFLQSSVDLFWQQVGRLLLFHVMALSCVQAMTLATQVRCEMRWLPALLILLISAANFIIFFVLLSRVERRYAELAQREEEWRLLLPDDVRLHNVRRLGRRGRLTYAVLVGVSIILVSVGFAAFPWSMTCS
ncbi:hypothetical protein ACJRO7_004672 [Eucalyptus globulus]|uniref:Transmembrane protein n=1 Tax=Eucalyptus globulus TaxID=34317 RepID=A0ABD3IXW4_EUCGL